MADEEKLLSVLNSSNVVEPTKKKHVMLTLQQKAQILRYLDRGSTVATVSQHFNVGRTTVHSIAKNREAISKAAQKYKGSGFKNRRTMKAPKFVALEESLYSWILQERAKNRFLPLDIVFAKAHQLFSMLQARGVYSTDASFVASNGWYDRFKNRYGLKTRAAEGESASENADAPASFIEQIEKDSYEQPESDDADESALFGKLLPSRTLKHGYIAEQRQEYFWRELSKRIGPIPTTVQVALEQTKFVHAGLIYLDDPTIDYVEADIRRLPTLLNKSEQDIAAMLDYRGNIKEFRFLTGERSIIKLIAAQVKEFGFQTFFTPQPKSVTESRKSSLDVCVEAPMTTMTTELTTPMPTPTTTTSTLIVPSNASEIRAEVKAKIYSYYDQRRENDEAEDYFFERLVDLEVDVRRDHLGDVARVFCPFCEPQQTIMIRRDKPGTWKVSNFSGHIKAKHDDMCFPGKDLFSGRKRSHREANVGDYVDHLFYENDSNPVLKLEL